MTWFTRFQTPQAPGFRVLAGRNDGLTHLLVASGRMVRGDHGTVHLHAGDEILRIVSGELVVRVGDEQQRCRQGDMAIIPPNTWHGFRALTDTVIEVVAEQAIGTFFPVRRPDGTRAIVETYRQDMPWTAPPPKPGGWTTDEEIQAILAAVDIEVEPT
jgi:mannose-6-phosphate isomerase-like protein (cupin superfamily)